MQNLYIFASRCKHGVMNPCIFTSKYDNGNFIKCILVCVFEHIGILMCHLMQCLLMLGSSDIHFTWCFFTSASPDINFMGVFIHVAMYMFTLPSDFRCWAAQIAILRSVSLHSVVHKTSATEFTTRVTGIGQLSYRFFEFHHVFCHILSLLC